MSHEFFLKWFGPGLANGIGLGTWLKVLNHNRWRIGFPYLGRFAVISCVAALNSIAHGFEQCRFGRAITGATVHSPLFVLGVWRSGTTHLHNLLCRDERFGFPNSFQGLNPHIFLSTENWFAPIQQRFLPTTRPFDNVRMGVTEPYEDEFALAVMSGLSPLYSWVFPMNHREYEKHIDFAQMPKKDVDRWKQALWHFLKKLSLKCDKPLVLKSPNHTARVRLLLDMFPQARFVYIHRHPHDVYASNLHLIRRVVPMLTLQQFNVDELCQRTVPWYRALIDAYLDQRSSIPAGQLVEVGFKELERAPIETMRRVYEQLNLPEFASAEPVIQAYLNSLSGYRKNAYAELDCETKSMLAREWKDSFHEWGYDSN